MILTTRCMDIILKEIKNKFDNIKQTFIQSDFSQKDSTQLDYIKGIIRQESLPEGYPYKDGETIHPMAPEFLPALTITSPNGTKYQLTVSDDGTLSAVAQS